MKKIDYRTAHELTAEELEQLLQKKRAEELANCKICPILRVRIKAKDFCRKECVFYKENTCTLGGNNGVR